MKKILNILYFIQNTDSSKESHEIWINESGLQQNTLILMQSL